MKFEFYEELVTRIMEFTDRLAELLQVNDYRIFARTSLINQLSHAYIQTIMEFFNQINFLGINNYQNQIEWCWENQINFHTNTKTFTEWNLAPEISPLQPLISKFLLQKLTTINHNLTHTAFSLDATPHAKMFQHLFFFVCKGEDGNYIIYLSALRVHTNQPLFHKRFYRISKKELLHPSPNRPPVSAYIINKGYHFYFNSHQSTYKQHKQMIKVFELLTLTHLSYKEIAYHADFNSYTTMYRIFVRYNCPLSSINRFLE